MGFANSSPDLGPLQQASLPPFQRSHNPDDIPANEAQKVNITIQSNVMSSKLLKKCHQQPAAPLTFGEPVLEVPVDLILN